MENAIAQAKRWGDLAEGIKEGLCNCKFFYSGFACVISPTFTGTFPTVTHIQNKNTAFQKLPASVLMSVYCVY